MMQTPRDQHDDPARDSVPPNPYQERQAAGRPDLDAGAPHLQASEQQRLNRKALLFLGGIVLLLLCVAFWIFSGAMSQADERGPRTRSEQVVIPAAPRDLPELPPERPQPPPLPELPPLPVYETAASSPAPSMPMPAPGWPERRGLSLQERRMMDVAGAAGAGGAEGGVPGMLPPEEYARLMMAAGNPVGPSVVEPVSQGEAGAKPLYNADTLLLRGTYIRCVLQSRVISDFPGYTSCVVTEPVYSVTGRRLLLPRGSKVLGSYEPDIVGNRVAVVWDRITTPTGLDVNMRSPGVDMLGAAGVPGHYSGHWGQRIASALLISMLSDAFKYAGAKHGPQETSIANGVVVQSPYESNTARTMERLANMALDRNMARPPTVTINQGAIVNVYVARDVDFASVLRQGMP